MSVIAAQDGRNLKLTIDGVEPFIVKPLPGFAGAKATEMFIEIAARQRVPEDLEQVWQMVLDGITGADENGDPIPVLDGPNWQRVRSTLSLHEGEDVIHPAFYWQTTLGIDGVNEFIESGGGLAGAKKVLERLILTLGISPMQTGRSGALGNLIQSLEPTPPISPSTTTLDKLPPHRRGFMQNRKQRRAQG